MFGLLHQVSYGSELSNRGPTFDMDLSDFMDGDKPLSYEKAKKYFAQDPSQKWVSFLCMLFVYVLLLCPTYLICILGGQHMLRVHFWF